MTTSFEVHIFDYSLSPEKAEMVKSVSGATLHEYGVGAEHSFVTAMERQLSPIPAKKLAVHHVGLGTFMDTAPVKSGVQSLKQVCLRLS